MTACEPPCGPITGGAGFGLLFPPSLERVLSPSWPLYGGQHGAPGEAQRSGFAGERRSSGMSEFSPLRGGNEGCGACDDDKQDKGRGRRRLLQPVTTARSAGSYGSFSGDRKWGHDPACAISPAVTIPKHLLPQQKNRGQSPERSRLWAEKEISLLPVTGKESDPGASVSGGRQPKSHCFYRESCGLLSGLPQRQRRRSVPPHLHQILPGRTAGTAGGTAVLNRFPADGGTGHGGWYLGRCLSVQRRGSAPSAVGECTKCEKDQRPHLPGTAGAGAWVEEDDEWQD